MLHFFRILAPACAASVIMACSRAGSNPSSGPSHSAAARTVSSGNACDRKLLTTADVAGIVTAPITGTKVTPGDSESCEFTTATFSSITVTLRPRMGKATVATWRNGRMPLSATPLAGVGDEAVWVEQLHEVVAEKNDLLCDIQVSGTGKDLNRAGADEQRRVGALCNKIFAAVQ